MWMNLENRYISICWAAFWRGVASLAFSFRRKPGDRELLSTGLNLLKIG
jgi:hypothetical protein